MALLQVLATVCLMGSISMATGADIELGQDGRYSGIIVSIDRSISTDWSLLDKLKASFQKASDFLALATKPVVNGTKSYAFGSVHFLLPANWGADNNESSAVAGGPPLSEDEGHFRVHEASSQELWTPQPFGCGRPGLFTLLHRSFVIAASEENLGRSLAHSFAHLRWGVYDEFNGHAGPHIYVKRGRLYPVRCSETLAGRLGHNETGAPCRVDRETLQPEPHCRYFVYDHQPLARASLMFVSYLDAVRQFCASVNVDPQFAHNADAPNPHNVHCLGAGVSDVMARHADFRLGPEVEEPDTRINFTEVRPRPAKRLVLVLDVSRSMRGEPMDKMKQSIQSLLPQLEDGVQCGLIAYSTIVRVLMPLGAINGTADRQAYWVQVRNLTATGVTATGDALAAAMKLLGCDLDRPSKQHSGQIVLITDGEENSRVRYSLDDVIEIARQTSVSIDTVAFGRLADARLANLSAATGGVAHFVRFLGPANDMAESLAQLTVAAPICLASDQLPGVNVSLSINVDQSATSGLQFFVASRTRPAELRLRLTTPGGDVIEGQSDPGAGVELDGATQLGSAILTLTGKIQTGKWQLNVSVESSQSEAGMSLAEAAASQSVVVSGLSASSFDWRPTLLRGSLSQSRAILDSRTRASVHAYLMSGSEFVRPADLWARVNSDDGLVASFRLFDHGAGADVSKADGIYSSYLPVHLMTSVQDYSISLQCLSPVSRVAAAGKFSVDGVDAGSLGDLPPARVTDLECGVNITSGTVRLSWTAVGDRLDSGTAAGYVVKSSVSRDALIGDFNSADNVTAFVVAPLPAGQPQILVIKPGQMATYNGTFYLALKAENADGRQSDLSNVVATQLTLPENLDEIEAGGFSTTSMEFSSTSSHGFSTSFSHKINTAHSQEISATSSQEFSTSFSHEESSAASNQDFTSGKESSQNPSTTSSQESSTDYSQDSSTDYSQGSSQQFSSTSNQKYSTESSQPAPTTSNHLQHITTRQPDRRSEHLHWLYIALIVLSSTSAIYAALACAGALIACLHATKMKWSSVLRRTHKIAPN